MVRRTVTWCLISTALVVSCSQGAPSAPASPSDAAPDASETPHSADAALRDAETSGSDANARPTPNPKNREVIIAASGDVMIHRKVLESARARTDGFQGVFAALGESIRELGAGGEQVVTLLNQETPLTEEYNPPLNAETPVLGSPAELATHFRRLGIDVLSFANNHAFDQTAAGLLDSLGTARDAGLATIGAGTTQASVLEPWITERGGLRVGFLGAAGHVNGGPGRHGRTPAYVARLRNEESLIEAITELRREVDIVVIAVHWSHDFVRHPLRNQRSLAERLVEAGADVILGTGPHVLQPVERLPSSRGGAVVAYSLGNVISNQGLRYTPGHRIRAHEHPVAITPGTRDVILLAIRASAPSPGQVELTEVRAVAFWTHNNFWERRGRDDVDADIRLRRLRDVEEELRTERLEEIGETLGPVVEVVP